MPFVSIMHVCIGPFGDVTSFLKLRAGALLGLCPWNRTASQEGSSEEEMTLELPPAAT